MRQTDLTLLEQLRITALEVEQRKALLSFAAEDADALLRFGTAVRGEINALASELYQTQADTLHGLQAAEKKYILDLFQGVYDLDYVQSRLQAGLVLKRMGIEPPLYLAVIRALKSILFSLMDTACLDITERAKTKQALDKLIFFDVTLVFETYVRSMVTEIELGKDRVMRYARGLEQRVAERTAELEKLSRTDPLTGLLNRRVLAESLQRRIRVAQRNAKPLTLIYFDLDDFKEINDRHGHARGDDVLKGVGEALRDVSRNVDLCFRLGGDEFCALLAESTADEARRVYCERLTRLIEERMPGVSLSIGVAQTGPVEFDDPDEIIRRADTAMYEAKRRNKAAAANTENTANITQAH
jgi:diguanylate cyclase